MKYFKIVTKLLHRYLGWISGIVVFILCVTGLLLLIQPEVERFVEPRRFVLPKNDAPVLSIDELIAELERSESESFDEPTTVRVTWLRSSKSPRRAWNVSFSARDSRDSWNYQGFADPRTGRCVAWGASRTSNFFFSVRRLHVFLWLPPKIGRQVAGYSCLIFALVLITGFIRWIPNKLGSAKQWKNALTLQLRKGAKRAIYDLHNVLGFYAALVLLLLALTGAYLALPGVRNFWNHAIGADVAKRPQVKLRSPEPSDETVALATILERQDEQTPRAKGYSIRFPSKNGQALEITPRGGFVDFARQDCHYWDRKSGTLLGVERYADLPTPLKINALLLPLHKGVLFGDATRYLFLLCCATGCILAATGYMLTWNRLGGSGKNVKKEPTTNVADSDNKSDGNSTTTKD